MINWKLELSGREERERKKTPCFSHFSCIGFVAPRVLNTPYGFKNYRFELPTEDSG